MSTINSFPAERLDVARKAGVTEYRRVCEEMLSSSCSDFMTNICLMGYLAIDTFTSLLRFNPQLARLVKTLHITVQDELSVSSILKRHQMRDLFLRLKSLQKVTIYCGENFISQFDNNACKIILNACPHINSFSVFIADKSAKYCSLLLNMRILLTTVDVDHAPEPPLWVEYLKNFPRLRKIHTVDPFANLKLTDFWFPLIQSVPSIRLITVNNTNYLKNFFHHYLARSTQAERAELIGRLGTVKTFIIKHGTNFCPETMTFAATYLTGLDELVFSSGNNIKWSVRHIQVFCDKVLDLFCHVKKYASIRVWNINKRTLLILLSVIPRSVLRLNQEATTTLSVHVKKDRPLDHRNLTLQYNREKNAIIVEVVGAFAQKNLNLLLKKSEPTQHRDRYCVKVHGELELMKNKRELKK